MKHKLPNRILFVTPLLFLACSILQPGRQPTPLPPSATPATPAVESAQTPIIKLSANDMVCPSENEDARRFYNDAGDLKDLGEFAEAETLYLQAIELDPEFCDAMDNLGQMLRQQDRIGEAISWYQKSLEIVPDNPVALQDLGLAYSLQGRTEEAVEQYEKLTEVAPENPEGYYGLGNIYRKLDQPEKAIPYFETAEKLYIEQDSPYVADAQYNLGFSYFALQDCEQTKKYLEPIYAQLSEDGAINYALGICYLMAEPADENTAREYILKAKELGISIPEDVLDAINEK